MMALTIRQPWVYCITHFDKRAENRSWKPSLKLIGTRMALHTSATRPPVRSIVGAQEVAGDEYVLPTNPNDYALGMVTCTAVLAGCVWLGMGGHFSSIGDIGDYDPRSDRWFFGLYAHLYTDIKMLATPLPAKGQLKYWHLPKDLEGRITYV